MTMKTRENDGFWMILVPGAVAWLRRQRRPVTPGSIHDALDRSGLLDSVKQRRSRTQIMKSIRRCCRDPGLFPEGDPRLR